MTLGSNGHDGRGAGRTGLDARIEESTRQERQAAMRLLLQFPLVTPTGHRGFGLVRRHSGWLREWLARYPGWSLIVNAEMARLRKTPAELTDATRGARDSRTGLPYTRRRYVLWCLALAVLERSDRQITLGRLAEELVGMVNNDAVLMELGIRFELAQQDERRDLVQVIRLLLDYEALQRVQGEEDRYVKDRQADVLYNVCRPVVAGFLAARRGPSIVGGGDFEGRLAELAEEPVPDSDEGRNRAIRTGLFRRLLDDPVVYYSRLSEAERVYLTRQRAFILQPISEATGLVAEIRAEGIAMVDPTGEATDLGLPEEGTDGHLTLLLADYLADRLRHQPGVRIGLSTLASFVAGQIKRHRAHWRRDVSEPGADRRLAQAVVERLEGLALARREGEEIVPLPALGRFGLRMEGDDES